MCIGVRSADLQAHTAHTGTGACSDSYQHYAVRLHMLICFLELGKIVRHVKMWSEWAIGRPIRNATRFIISGIALESQTIRIGDAGIISYC